MGGRVRGYTLIEIIVAVMVFTVGALGLAASSGVVARAMAGNATRELAARIAVNRIETIASRCATATSGREKILEIESEWVTTNVPRTTEVSEWVHYPVSGRPYTINYRATMWCPQ